MRIVFMGTPDFSATVLKRLLESDNEVLAVVTRADKPAGRGNELRPSAVKKLALENGLEVLQPEKLSDEGFITRMKELNADIAVVVAYGKILPESILNMPKFGCINAHASLLPKYRGAAPMQRAIMNCEPETGVTIMKMDKGLDTDDMILVSKTPITESDNLESIHDRLADMSGDAIVDALKLIESGNAVYVKQNDADATYAEKILKNDEIIDLNRSAEEISAQIRALDPFPNAYCKFNGKILKILSATADMSDDSDKKPGEVLSVKNGQIRVKTGMGTLVITRVFPESKRRMNALDFINGSKIKPGDMLE